ncbi:MAG: hypothetical protein ACTSQY_05250 [Candidatus Odinarchaeia archaeon]
MLKLYLDDLRKAPITGLRDKDDKGVYEGDIIKWPPVLFLMVWIYGKVNKLGE